MTFEAVEFGKNDYPDKVLCCLTHEDVDGLDTGAGLLICDMKSKGNLTWDDARVTTDDVGEPIIALWFHRAESLDATIRNLMKVRELFDDGNGEKADEQD